MTRFAFSALILTGLALVVGCSESTADETSSDDVVTRRCPEGLSVEFKGLDAYSFAEIEQRTGFQLNQDDRNELRHPIRRIETMPNNQYKAALKLKTAVNAQCHYESASPTKKVTAKFYTKSGKNILRVDAADPASKDLSFYVTLNTYNKESVALAYPNAGIFFRASDSEAAFRAEEVGRAASAKVSVTPPANVPPTDPVAPLTDDQLLAQLTTAVDGVEYMSETDAPYTIMSAPMSANEAMTPAVVKAKLSGQAGTDEDGVALKDLIGGDTSDFVQWFEDDLVEDPSLDEYYQKHAAAMRKVHALLTASCTDLTIVLAAGSDLSGSHDVGLVQVFIVGRSKASGKLIALHTLAVWT